MRSHWRGGAQAQAEPRRCGVRSSAQRRLQPPPSSSVPELPSDARAPPALIRPERRRRQARRSCRHRRQRNSTNRGRWSRGPWCNRRRWRFHRPSDRRSIERGTLGVNGKVDAKAIPGGALAVRSPGEKVSPPVLGSRTPRAGVSEMSGGSPASYSDGICQSDGGNGTASTGSIEGRQVLPEGVQRL